MQQGFNLGSIKLSSPVILPDGTRNIELGSGVISELLGRGGMAHVYKIWNAQMEKHRAVKLMLPNLASDAIARFQTEIKITAALSHPNIIEIHSVGEWNGLDFIEMEYIDGLTMADVLLQRGALPLPVVTALGICICRALNYAHSKEYLIYGKKHKGVIHRDLKPSNIMFSADGRVKLMDFGIARPVDDSLMTTDGAIMGTMQYLAPEQLDGKNIAPQSDLYTFGAVLYEAITGQKAFPQTNIAKLMKCKTDNEFMPLDMFVIKIPPRLKRLVHKCMKFEMNKRFADANKMLNELIQIHADLTPDTPEHVTHQFMAMSSENTVFAIHTRSLFYKKKRIIASIVLFVIAVGITVGFLMQPAPKKVQPPAPVIVTQSITAPIASPSVNQKSKKSTESKVNPIHVTRPSVKPTPVQNYLDDLRTRYGLTDEIAILSKEVANNRYQSAIQVYELLSKENAASDQARILYMRSLFALGKNEELSKVLNGTVIDDAEFFLKKAALAYSKNETLSALRMLELSLSASARYLDAESARVEYLYLKALCSSRMFDQNINEESKRKAMDSWYELKSVMRSNTNHSYFKKALTEMQRIGMNNASR